MESAFSPSFAWLSKFCPFYSDAFSGCESHNRIHNSTCTYGVSLIQSKSTRSMHIYIYICAHRIRNNEETFTRFTFDTFEYNLILKCDTSYIIIELIVLLVFIRLLLLLFCAHANSHIACEFKDDNTRRYTHIAMEQFTMTSVT